MSLNILKGNVFYLKHLKLLNKTFSRCMSRSENVTPVQLSFAAYENAKHNYTEAPYVVIHGLFGSKQNWTSLCKAYSQKLEPPRKVIALDLRNHGDSVHSEEHTYAHLVEDIKYFLVSNNIEKILLMGHSMGGRCAMLFALTYPEQLEKLIVIDISPVTLSPNISEMPNILGVMQRVQLPKNIPLSQARTIVDSQLAEVISDKDVRSFLLTNLVATEDQTYKWRINIPTLIRKFDEIAKFPTTKDTVYTGDTLFIGGGESNYIPQSDYPKILKLFPNAELKYIEGAGHWVHAEKPNEFLKLTLEFLNKKETAVH